MTLNELVGTYLFNWDDKCERPLDLKFLDVTSFPDEVGYFSYAPECDWVPISGFYDPCEYLSDEYANAKVIAFAAAGEDSLRIQVVCGDEESKPEPVAIKPTEKVYAANLYYGYLEGKDGIEHTFELDAAGGTVDEKRIRMGSIVDALAADLGTKVENDNFDWGAWYMKIPDEMVERIRKDAIADYLEANNVQANS